MNNCKFPVVVQASGGNTDQECYEDVLTCPLGTVCQPPYKKTAQQTVNGTCFFETPQELNETPILEPGKTLGPFPFSTPNPVAYNQTDKDGKISTTVADWSGRLSYYEHKGDLSSAYCNAKPEEKWKGVICPPWQGLNGVSTLSEVTFSPFSPDFYDVSVIDGFSIATSFGPSGNFTRVNNSAAGSTKGYNCGVAGAVTDTDQLSKCTWDNDQPDYGYNMSLYGAMLRMVDDPTVTGNGARSNPDSYTKCNKTDDPVCTSKNASFVCGQRYESVYNAGYRQPTDSVQALHSNRQCVQEPSLRQLFRRAADRLSEA